MAVFCPAHDLLFIGNQRTASTAVGRALVDHCGGLYLPEQRTELGGEIVSKRHATLAQLIRLGLLEPAPDTLLKFVAVRNPFDSLVSTWVKRRHRQRYANSRAARRKQSFDEYLAEKLGSIEPGSMHAMWVEGMDVVIRYENLQAELTDVLQKAGAPTFELPVVNKTVERRGSYRDYYSTASRRLVEEKYGADLERFGYSF